METVIDQQHHEWETLYRIWLEQRRPGYVVLGGNTYQVLQPSDDDIRFKLASGGIDSAYASMSGGLS